MLSEWLLFDFLSHAEDFLATMVVYSGLWCWSDASEIFDAPSAVVRHSATAVAFLDTVKTQHRECAAM